MFTLSLAPWASPLHPGRLASLVTAANPAPGSLETPSTLPGSWPRPSSWAVSLSPVSSPLPRGRLAFLRTAAPSSPWPAGALAPRTPGAADGATRPGGARAPPAPAGPWDANAQATPGGSERPPATPGDMGIGTTAVPEEPGPTGPAPPAAAVPTPTLPGVTGGRPTSCAESCFPPGRSEGSPSLRPRGSTVFPYGTIFGTLAGVCERPLSPAAPGRGEVEALDRARAGA